MPDSAARPQPAEGCAEPIVLGRLCVLPRTGAEPLHEDGRPLGLELRDLWRWSASDLVSNVVRGVFAEFLVAYALGIDVGGVRDSWAAFDLVTPAGVRIEVKSAAYVQSWAQRRLSAISFSVRPTRGWNAETGLMAAEAVRQADVYVLALLAHADKATVDPLNVDQWRFFVVPAPLLNARTRSQHSITLKSLRAIACELRLAEVANAITEAARKLAPS